MKKMLTALLVILAVVLIAHITQADPRMYSVEDFFSPVAAGEFYLSSDGASLYFSAPADGFLAIHRRDVASGSITRMTFGQTQDINDFFVIGNTLLYVQDNFGDEVWHIFRVNEDGQSTNLTPFEGAITVPVSIENATDTTIFVLTNRANFVDFHMYSLNIITGEMVRLFEMPLLSPIVDNAGVIRIFTVQDGMSRQMFYRASETDDFVLAGDWGFEENATPHAFDLSNRYVYALSNLGRNTQALVLMDPSNGQEVRLIYENPSFDVIGVELAAPGVLGAVHYYTYRPVSVFFDDGLREFFAQLSSSFGDEIVEVVGASSDRLTAVVHTSSDTNRGRVYLVDLRTQTSTLLADNNGRLNPAHMAPTVPISYIARDGLEITGLLTLPVGVPAENLPAIIMPHGGPWSRDVWGWNSEVQFLANRGYAVLQPNYRGSLGFGLDFLRAGHKQWGLAMQDDLTDAALWLVSTGIADPARLAIVGGSYGGFAALSGATFTPELFAAAISYVGVSNLFTFMETIPAWWETQREFMHHAVGHPERDFDQLYATSPVFHADQITTPLLIVHGANDPRVPLDESLQIVGSMMERGQDVTFFVAFDEGHGFFLQDNIVQLYRIVEAFLAEHLGGRTMTTLADLPEPLFDTMRLAAMLEGQEEMAGHTDSLLPETAQLLDVVDGMLVGMDEFWGIIVVETAGIPHNIDGRQGADTFIVAEITAEHVGLRSVRFDMFSAGLSEVNVGVEIDGTRLAGGMNLAADGGLDFVIEAWHVGEALVVVMSTNCGNGGVARVTVE